MMIPCNYYINVAKRTFQYPNGVHYCKIELDNCSEKEAKEKFDYLLRIFNTNDFDMRLYKVTCYGEEVKD